MSSRAASGRKRLRPAPAAPSPPSTVRPSPQPNASAFNRPEINSSVSYASPEDLRTPEAPMHLRSVPPPSPSTPSSSSSGFPRHFPYSSQPSRDLLHRAQRSSQTADGLTPYPLPSQFQPYQPPPMRKEKPVALRARNPSPESQSPNPAPSYTSFSVHFSDSEGGDSRRSSTSRVLPPYPSTPPVATGWAALSDMKVASAIAVPPSYPEDLHPETNPYPSPPLQPSFDLQNSNVRPGSVASFSRLPSTPERSETPRSNYHPPYYSPPSSPRLLPSRLEVSSSTLGARSPQQRNRPLDSYSPAASYPTPHSSSFSSPSASLASLPVISSRLDTHHESSLSGSSDSISGGSLTSSTRPGRYHGNPAIQSSQSVSSSSSAKSDPSPTTEARSADPAFVFPSSRSRARPSGSTPGVSGFKFRRRRKLKAPLATVQVLAPGTPIPSEGVFTAQPQSRPQIRAKVAASNGGAGRPAPPPPNLRLAPTISAGSGSSGSGPGSPAAVVPTFYFPSARTRAHPKSPTQFSFSKGKKKEHDGVKQSRFLRMGLNRKKVDSTPVVVQDESPFPMEQTLLTSPPHDERRLSPEGQDASGRENVTQVATKVGTYLLDAYDAALMESDRQTWELLRKLSSTNSPSFHNYGGCPPRYVLDLGCGAGHWMLDAAVAWRNSDTQIIGFDMVDTTKGLWSAAQRQGVANNIRFVRGNFLKQSLPFPDASFQLVRMASLALCIPHDMWEFVLHEAHRVLAVGGRLEFVDDHVFFPYGKPPLMSPSAPPQSAPAPHLDMIPSTMFSRMSLADVVNPSLKEDTDSEIYNLYGVEEEEGEHSDADTVASGPQRETPTPHGRSSSTSSLSGPPADPEAWHEQAAAARELESLFEHMVNVKYGIHLRPSEFIFEMMMRVFGAAKEITAMHLTLAPPDQSTVGLQSSNQRPTSSNVRPRASSEAPDSDTLGHCPGLILWPTTFIPMTLTELETHASKHLRVLLSCKSALVNYASEIADQGEAEIQGEAAMEALWEYQNFLRERYNPPPEDPTRGMSDTSSTDDANSIRNSLFSVSSVGSEALDAMRDYQSELHSRFEWTSEPARSLRETPTPTATPRASVIESLAPPPASTSAPPRVRKSRSRGSRGRDRASSVASTVAPPYSRIELTHVRTFYIYEAVKVVDARFGGPI